MDGKESEFSHEKKSFFSSLPKSLTTVTPFSKLVAGLLFITLPFVGTYIGYKYGQNSASEKITSTNLNLGNSFKQIPTPTLGSGLSMKTYNDTKYGFSLSYPNNWVIDTSYEISSNKIFFSVPQQTSAPELYHGLEIKDNWSAAQEYKTLSQPDVDTTTDQNGKVTIIATVNPEISAFTNVTINGLKGGKFMLTTRGEGVEVFYTVINKNGKAFIFSTPSSVDTNFDGVINSLKFL